MIYKVSTYIKGYIRRKEKITASSHFEAARLAEKVTQWTHVRVAGRTTKRYNTQWQEIRGVPMFFKIDYKGSVPAILVMYANLPEIHTYPSSDARNEAYDNIQCIISTSAESAKIEAELTDTTVSYGETKDTKNTSTLPKTSSGSVTSVTWQDLLTRESTDKNSGTNRSDDTASSGWPSGLTISRSKHRLTSKFGTVKNIDPASAKKFPGATKAMVRKAGKTIMFKSGYSALDRKYWYADGYVWHADWIDFKHAYFTVNPAENINRRHVMSDNGALLEYTKRFAGKVIRSKPCSCGCGSYYTKNHYFKLTWLTPSSQEEYDKQNMETGRTNNR